jgi:hypothetical protein
MAVLGGLLFFRRDGVDLDHMLRHQGDAVIRGLIERLPDADFDSRSDEELVVQITASTRVQPLEVAFDKATADVKEVTLDINDMFGDRARVKGLRATKKIPFTGDRNLWELRTNPYDTNPPRGEVMGQAVVIGMEVPEHEAGQAASYIDDTIARMKEYLERQRTQIAAFNASLPARVPAHIHRRRSSRGKAAELLKKLQG